MKVDFVIPVYNEEQNVNRIYEALREVLEKEINKGHIKDFGIIFVNDGSRDNSEAEIEKIVFKDNRVTGLHFSRNFGKEAATSAGLHNAYADAVMMLDADLQHPVELVPEFIKKWQEGSDVVLGKIKKSKSSLHKRLSRKIFYFIMSKIQDGHVDMTGNDFRLMDSQVVEAFKKLEENGRSTRNLIDWLGFRRSEIYFTPNEREYGEASYTTSKLIKLAINSIVSNSLFPLRVAGYLGVLIFSVSSLMGVFIFVNKYMLTDGMGFSYPAILAVVNMFLISIVLICLWLMAIYVGHIRVEALGRPLYVIRKDRQIKEKQNHGTENS